VSLQLNQASTVVIDNDHSAASRELIHRFRPPYFRQDKEIASGREGIAMLDKGEAMIVLDIPPRFQEKLLKGEQTTVQMQVDTTNTVLGLLATSYGENIVGRFGLEAGLSRAGLSSDALNTAPNIVDAHRIWFNPNQQDSWFMAVIEMLTIISLFAILLPAAAMAREKEKGTVEQLLVSPLTPFQIMLPKVLSMTVVALAGTAVSLFGILELIFHVPIQGSLALFFAITTLYIVTSAGIGLFIATIARNLAQVGMLTILVFAPMIFLSGAWTPPEAMPVWMRLLMGLSPLHYFMDACLGILLKGAGMAIIWDSVAGIIMVGGAAFCLGLWRFNRQFD
jgi:ABC-2 type transport system permease protein